MLMRTDPAQWNRLADLFEGQATPLASMDAYRLGDVVTVELDLPGVDPATIDVQIERGELRVSAYRRRTSPDNVQYLIRERTQSTVTRRIMLGDVLDVEHVDAEFVDGVLTLRIPLRDSAKPRRIDVRHRESTSRQAISVDSA
jgi:HSP20 family protein